MRWRLIRRAGAAALAVINFSMSLPGDRERARWATRSCSRNRLRSTYVGVLRDEY
jgi:hypothetical protein